MSLLKSFSSYFVTPQLLFYCLVYNCLALPTQSIKSYRLHRPPMLSHYSPEIVVDYPTTTNLLTGNNKNNNNIDLQFLQSNGLVLDELNDDDDVIDVDNSLNNNNNKNDYIFSPPLNAELDDINPLIPVFPTSHKSHLTSHNDNKDLVDNLAAIDDLLIRNNNVMNNLKGDDGRGEMYDKNSFDVLRKQIDKVREEEDVELKSELLKQILMAFPEGPLPIVYVEDTKPTNIYNSDLKEANLMDKRSGRYYRRYPWKRQQKGRGSYDPEARYVCTPSRDEIFRLLVGLHETHKGNDRKLVNFCNRKRPAKAVFTNIRFLG